MDYGTTQMIARDTIQKFVFVGVIIAAALIARGAHYGVSQSADIATVTAARVSSSDVSASPTVDASGFSLGATVADAGDQGIRPVEGSTTGMTNQAPDNGLAPFVRTGLDPAPSLDYHEALIADLQSGVVLFGDHTTDRWPIASISKLMTAAVTIDNLSIDQKITITPEAFAIDPSESTLAVGDTYTVSDLLRIMLLRSSNVAAEALADFYGYGRFLAAMNARAHDLGMQSTYYNDPSGLSSANQSTANDLTLLAQKIYADYPQILALTRLTQATVTNLATNKKIVVKTINDFAGRSDFVGGKTGYTDLADGNLLSIFRYEGRPIIIIIMGTDDAARFTNTETLYNWFKANYR
jgi:D-alanyl-D-alanine endopeptidase (penicillin-binding protein 7)